MNLTIIYGNGFDKNLGLNTTYPEFYEWLKENKKREDDEIYCNIKEQPENWSDLELALGKYTFDNEINTEKFEESYATLIEDLNEYLLLEQEKLENNFSLQNIIIDLFSSIGNNLVETGQNKNAKIMRNALSETVTVNFVTFNYTNTLDKMIVGKSHSINRISFPIYLKDPIHVHGKLNNSMVLGVNDKTQFNAELFDNEFPEFFVKNKNLTDHVNNTELDEAMEAIKKSNIIFLFGVSLGDTDQIYWEEIAMWLFNDSKRIVLLYDYDTPIESISKVVQSKMERCWNKTKDKFLKQSGFDSKMQKQISNQIFPLYGNGFFNLNDMN